MFRYRFRPIRSLRGSNAAYKLRLMRYRLSSRVDPVTEVVRRRAHWVLAPVFAIYVIAVSWNALTYPQPDLGTTIALYIVVAMVLVLGLGMDVITFQMREKDVRPPRT